MGLKTRIRTLLDERASERGQSLVIVALVMIGLLAIVGLAVDVGFLFARRAQLSAAVDAAALAGVTELAGVGGIGSANTRALQYLHSNGISSDITFDTFESDVLPPNLLGVTQYAITVTWPVEMFFLRVIGQDDVMLQRSATAGYFPQVDIYASRRVEDGALSTSNQSVFGPGICTGYGDPVSPGPGHNPQWGVMQGIYHYRIAIPPNYPSNILRVELFDPDSMNVATNSHTVVHTQVAIDDGMPAIEPLNCSQTDRRSACLIPTGESGLGLPVDSINLWWFVRIDENRGTGTAPGNGNCGQPSSYNTAYNTATQYSLFYYAQHGDGSLFSVNLASYTGQTGSSNNPYGDYDRIKGTAFANHATDLQWVAPGGQMVYDQLAQVPADCGSPNGGYSIPGTGNGGSPEREGPGGRCYISGAPADSQPLYSPPGAGKGFEIDLTYYNNIAVDQLSGNRYIYLDVRSLWGASENGFEIWAGPPTYLNTYSANANTRNVQIVNSMYQGAGTHSSMGATVLGLGRLPMNSNYNNVVDVPLLYVGPELAGEEIYVSMFDPDAGAKPPIHFYFDSIAFDDYHVTYGQGNDPDGRCFDRGNGYNGECNNQWVTPDFIVPIPNLESTCSNPNGNPRICTPFYGGRLIARYKAGQGDTYSWRIIMSGLPYLLR